jgi:[calcium/calmodulin-dependent protein kinase] kinase
MFQKDTEMRVSKTAGSPAFIAPELCVIRHDEVSGVAADIWSMGVTLYCLKFGKVPFCRTAVLDMYKSIINDPVDLGTDCPADLKNLLERLLEKDPKKRITMPEIRVRLCT